MADYSKMRCGDIRKQSLVVGYLNRYGMPNTQRGRCQY